MADSQASQDARPAAKRMKMGGQTEYGKTPKEFLDGENNITKMVYRIHNFTSIEKKRGEHIATDAIKGCDHLWKLTIHPRGHDKSKTNVEYVSVGLYYVGENNESDPVVAKARLRTKKVNKKIPRSEYTKKKCGYAVPNYSTREDTIKNDCDDAGTLTVTVELQVATEKRSVWFPQLTDCDFMLLHKSIETSDATVMAGTKEFQLHKCVLAVRWRILYELVLTEESPSSFENNNNNNNCVLVRTDVDENIFEILVRFVYSSEELPKLGDNDEAIAKSILVAANRFGVTELKLYVESILVEKFLVPSKAASFLLFADAYTCPLLKEKSMTAYMTDPTAFMNSEDDWNKLQESPKLLTELLVYTNNDRQRYSSVVDGESNGDDTLLVENVDDFDVTSLRERLQQAKLDVDGSRSMLVQRWKDYVTTNTK